ncbi:hypothetical protein C8Q73DRAFT_696229 [Cubamyces lactineus]|nr:hypothetical protein C8Q73DRAFT_696229 [Cubamyces lactineus]
MGIRLESLIDRTVAVAETILIAMTCYKTYDIKKISMQTGIRVPLTDVLTREGTLHFLYAGRLEPVRAVINHSGLAN